MARALTSPQIALLQSQNIKARWLVTFFLDSGTYYFCDDVNDMTDSNGQVYVGASALASINDIISSAQYSAESVTMEIDGTRIQQMGFEDPAQLFREIMALEIHQRRVNVALGFAYIDSLNLTLEVPVYAGKINNIKVTDDAVDFGSITSGGGHPAQQSNLTLTLDSLAQRYQWATSRTRSQSDQLELDPTDNFFSFVNDTIANEQNIYWGTLSPIGKQALPQQIFGNIINILNGRG